MPHQKFALERGGEKDLDVSLKYFSVNIEIHYKGSLIGVIRKQSELREGRTFELPDGTQLLVKRGRRGLQLQRNGMTLPGTAADPEVKLAISVNAIYLIASLNIILSILAVVLRIDLLLVLGFGIISGIVGIILFVLGIFTKRRSLAALILALIIQGLMSALIASNIVALFYLSFAGSNTLLLEDILESVSLWIGAIIIYFGEYFLIFTGIGAIRKLKGKRE